MNKLRRVLMWAALVLIVLLIFLSGYGAFLGTEKAKTFFNSLPLAFYWLALIVLLVTALMTFRRLIRSPSLMLIHLGCISILAGSIWGSNAGHKLQNDLFGIDKIQTAYMTIFEGQSENRLRLDTGQPIKDLPFAIKLKDLQIKYYEPEYLYVQTRKGQNWKIPVEVGTEFSLGPQFGSVTITRAFKNFKITIKDDKKIVTDDSKPGFNPALEVQLKATDTSVKTRYVFERFPSHTHPEDRFLLSYRRVIRDYISQLQVIENGKVLTEKNIEVNKPLKFGGYHFYQHSYDDKMGQYTILMVVSDSGISLVYAGYVMLCVAVFWQFWLRHMFTRKK